MTNLISTNLLGQWYREQAITEINEVFTDEMDVNPDDYRFIAEFERLTDVIAWWIAQNPQCKNLPEQLIRCLDDHAVLREIKKDFVIIVLEREAIKHFYYVFAEKNNTEIFEDRND